MQINRKPILNPKALGGVLRRRRKELGLTLAELATSLDVDVSQLSRFERADFKYVSRNLQKTMIYLQISDEVTIRDADETEVLLRKFTELLNRSERHRTAAIALVDALQVLK